MRLGVRLRRPPSQPDADSQVETRKTRITLGDFRWAFPVRSGGGGSGVGGIRMECSRVLDKSSTINQYISVLYDIFTLGMFHFRPQRKWDELLIIFIYLILMIKNYKSLYLYFIFIIFYYCTQVPYYTPQRKH